MTTIALFSWPFIVLILFAKLKRTDALIWSILGGYLLLPNKVEFNLPVLPTLDKNSIPTFAAVIGAVWVARSHAPQRATAMAGVVKERRLDIQEGWLPRLTLARLLLALIIFGAFMTAFTNGSPLIYGPRVLSAMRPYDAFSNTLFALTAILPMLLGRKYLAHPEAHRDILRIICLAALAYSLLALVEVRLSPQLHRWIYGFHVQSFAQTARGGGFRPTVFLAHGLHLGLFFACALIAAIGYMRSADKRYIWAAAWLFIILFLVKSLGALLIGLVLMPVVFLFKPRWQMICASIVVLVFLTFPALRAADYVPTQWLVEQASKLKNDRSGSLQFRFDNEDILLEKARQKPLFGWGTQGRSRVFDENGNDIGVTDGLWVIRLGVSGWTGYLAEFGLLTLSVLLLTFRKKHYEVTIATSALCVLLAGNLIDLIPNAGLTPMTWLVAGALLGRLELSREVLAKLTGQGEAAAPLKPAGPSYARPRAVKPTRSGANNAMPSTDMAQTAPTELPEHLKYTRRSPKTPL